MRTRGSASARRPTHLQALAAGGVGLVHGEDTAAGGGHLALRAQAEGREAAGKSEATDAEARQAK